MRCNQVTIKIERFGECCPKEYPRDKQEICVYCDSHDNIYAALSKAYSQCINILSEYEKIGVSCDAYTNDKEEKLRCEDGLIIFDQVKDTIDLQQKLTALNYELWGIEHAEDLVKIIKNSKNIEEAKSKIQKKYELSETQVDLMVEMRLDLLTHEDYLSIRNERDKINQRL